MQTKSTHEGRRMKKIYSGSELAVVVLDSAEEIEVVTLALADFIPRSGGTVRPAATTLLREMTAEAPA